MELSDLLRGAQSPDPTIRKPAEHHLLTAAQTQLPAFITALASTLSSSNTDLHVRQLAGIQIKNLLSNDNPDIEIVKRNNWREVLTEEVRGGVRECVLHALCSDVPLARSAATLALAAIASTDLPKDSWPALLDKLKNNISDPNVPDAVKVSTLETVGYTCERLGSEEAVLSSTSTNKILTCIIDGLGSTRHDNIRLAAAKALRNGILFCRSNMEHKEERDVILNTICSATQSTDAQVRAASFEVICAIAVNYYERLTDYMQVLFQLSLNAIKTDLEEVAVQGVEFWTSLAEEEISISDETIDCEENKEVPTRTSCRYILGGLGHIVPVLLECLTKQNEEEDEDDTVWNLQMAAGTCLQQCAAATEDSIVSHVIPFVLANIQGGDWRMREASIMAFSCVLDGPSTEGIGSYVNQSIPVLIESLNDPHTMVKDTTAWTLGRICELHAGCVPPDVFPRLVNGLMSVLIKETPKVSSAACYALHNLASQFNKGEATNLLSSYTPQLLKTLLEVTERPDHDESNLRVTAYEAVSMIVQHSALDVKPLLLQMLPVVIGRLNESFGISSNNSEESNNVQTVQSLLCGLIQVIVQSLSPLDLTEAVSDTIMHSLIEVFKLKNPTAHEEAFLATGALCDKLSKRFSRYAHNIIQYVMAGLRNHEAYQVCTVAVGVVGDMARALEGELQPFCDDVIRALLEDLQNPALNREVKPHVLSCFGDIALAIGRGFEPYLNLTMSMLFQASQTLAPEDDEELIDYVNTLREGILEAFTGIIQGLKDGKRVEIIEPYVTSIMAFLEVISNDNNKDESVLNSAVGCLGDLASAVGQSHSLKGALKAEFVGKLVEEGLHGERSREVAEWTRGVVRDCIR